MKGYTLIELLVGITIIGLIFSFGFVSFREFSRRQSILGAAKNIKGDLRLAQEEALSGTKPDEADCNSPETLRGYNFRVTSSTTYTLEASCSGGDIETKEITLPSDVSMSTPEVNPILFKAVGQGTNIDSGSTIVLTLTQVGTGTQATVTISASGDIR